MKRAGLDLDLDDFKPKNEQKSAALVREISHETGFAAKNGEGASTSPNPRRRREKPPATAFNQRISVDCLELFYRIADAQDWDNRRTVDEAVKALAEKYGVS